MSDQTNNPIQDASVAQNLTEEKVLKYREALIAEQDFPMAILSGSIASILGALLWAAVTIATNYQIGWMAVGVGFLVGFSVRKMGKGIEKSFGVIGALFALLGCLLGNLFTIIGFAANEEGLGYIELLLTADYAVVFQIMSENFGFMDIVFYGVAVYEGYRFSFRQLTDNDIANMSSI